MKNFVQKHAMTFVVIFVSVVALLLGMASAQAGNAQCMRHSSSVAVDQCHYQLVVQMDGEIERFYGGDGADVNALKKQGVVGKGRLHGRFMQNASLFRDTALNACGNNYDCLYDLYAEEYMAVKERRALIRKGVLNRVLELKGNEENAFLFHSESKFMYDTHGPSYPALEPAWLVEQRRAAEEEAEWHAATAAAREEVANMSIWDKAKLKAQQLFGDEPADSEEFVGD